MQQDVVVVLVHAHVHLLVHQLRLYNGDRSLTNKPQLSEKNFGFQA